MLGGHQCVAIRHEGSGTNGKKTIQAVGPKQGHARQGPGTSRRLPDERRLCPTSRSRADAQAVLRCPQALVMKPSTAYHMRAMRLNPGGRSAIRESRIAPAPAGISDRRADAAADRRRPAGERSLGLDGGRQRRRHPRSGDSLAAWCGRAARRRRRPFDEALITTSAATTACDRGTTAEWHQEEHRVRPSPAPSEEMESRAAIVRRRPRSFPIRERDLERDGTVEPIVPA